jgi:hypothetical protein
MYLLDDTPQNRKLIRRYVEVWEYPDGRIEIRADGRALPYREYDRLTEVDQGAIVEHKRLGHVLQVSQVIQAQRDNERIGKAPDRRSGRAKAAVAGSAQIRSAISRRERNGRECPARS